MYRTGLGQDSHRFLPEDSTKPCVIGGLIFDNVPGFKANSDGDVVLHAICNAITSLTGILILGGVADELYHKHGITDSSVYLEKALEHLSDAGQTICHVAVSIEASRPHFSKRIVEMRTHVAALLGVDVASIGITATSGEGLTDFGCGDGIQCFAILTTKSA